ncbi:MAG: TFIIB-type zinc finger domain-containing protein [Cyanobacteriota bacterium]|nr:TFIIB-type zinc finger domain-containing protein [Cyanobacteriota bacterium]
MSSSEPTIKRFPCPQCGAEATFNPQVGKLKCDYCGWEDEIPQTAALVEENSYEQYLNTNHTRLETLSSTALEVSCNNCGASITFEPPQVAGQCPFCAAAIVSQPQLADPTLAPQGIVPFALGRRDARKHLQKWIDSRRFAPSALKDLAQQEKIQGVYLPFWTYDAQTHSHYTGDRGDYYYVTETYTETNAEGEEETNTREVRHTRWHSTSGRVSRFFDDILVPATKLVDLSRLRALEPWHLQDSLRPYEPSYLAGFEAQRSQVSLKEGFATAKSAMAAQIHIDVKRDIGGDEQRVGNISTSYSAITFKPILLPVWLTSYRYNNQQYQVLINARTGEIQGDRPYSKLKITLAVIGGILAAALIIGLIAFLSR